MAMRRLLAVIALLAPAAVRAHAITDPRVLVILAGTQTLELRVNEMTPVAESTELRRRFDGDGNGRLDDSEQSDLESFLAIRATAALAVEEGGRALPLSTRSRVLRSAGSRVDASEPLSIDVVLEARPAAAGEVTLTVKDHRSDDHVVRAAVVAATGVTLASASLGALDAKRGLVTGVALDRSQVLVLRYRR